MKGEDELAEDATLNANRAIDGLKSFPENVFHTPWTEFHFFCSDRIFERAFVWDLKALMDAEGSSEVAIVNLDRQERGETEQVFIVTNETLGAHYERILAGHAPGYGWIAGMDRYVCASNVGKWCIYAERANELAVIAFMPNSFVRVYAELLQRLGAVPISEVTKSNTVATAWVPTLMARYRSSTQK